MVPRKPRDLPKFGSLIRRFRLDAGMTAEQLGEAIDVTGAYVVRIETGSARPQSADKMEAISRVLGIPLEKLYAAAKVIPPSMVEAFAENPEAFFALMEMTAKQRKQLPKQKLSAQQQAALKRKLMK